MMSVSCDRDEPPADVAQRKKPESFQEHISYALDSMKSSVDRRYKQVMCCGYPDIALDHPNQRRWEEKLALGADWGEQLSRESLAAERRPQGGEEDLMAKLEQAKEKVRW